MISYYNVIVLVKKNEYYVLCRFLKLIEKKEICVVVLILNWRDWFIIFDKLLLYLMCCCVGDLVYKVSVIDFVNYEIEFSYYSLFEIIGLFII